MKNELKVYTDIVALSLSNKISHVDEYKGHMSGGMRVFFRNGLQLSIIREPSSFLFEGRTDVYEIAPFDSDGCFDRDILGIEGDDIIDGLSREQVIEYIKIIANKGEFYDN